MLELCSLGKRYPDGTVALADFSLQMEEGVLGLLGPNGAGKSTLMSILATITAPTSGTFRWNGRDGVADPRGVRASLGYLPQDFGIYEQLTAREFLAYLGRLRGLASSDLRQRVSEVLELVNLHGSADRRLGGFSGGMRQRVGIAQMLLGDPRLIVVDEPTVGLDPEERVRFRNLLSEIAHRRLVVFSTHIVSDVEAVATWIAVMRKGRLVTMGRPETLLAQAEGRVFSVVAARESLADLQRQVRVSGLVLRPDGVHVRFVGDPRRVPGALAVPPTLEDAYLMFEPALGVPA
jgi:ABC-2 type transport system ATP-binding protein